MVEAAQVIATIAKSMSGLTKEPAIITTNGQLLTALLMVGNADM